MRKTVHKGETSKEEGIHSNSRHDLKMSKFLEKAEPDILDPGVLYSRQSLEETDPFTGMYDSSNLLEPPYLFTRLQTIYEESDLLQECIEAMIKNVDGFGYKLLFLGDDVKEAKKPEMVAEEKYLTDFFDYANDEQSWATIRKLMRQDFECLGNGSFEVIRNLKGDIAMVTFVPFKFMRTTSRDKKGVTIVAKIPRGGKLIEVRVRKYFRKYAQYNPLGRRVTWFKEYGDPRFMDATDGSFKTTRKECKEVASEIIHFKSAIGGGAYGIPRWIGTLLDVVGRRSSQYVNYDLFENQGIPPILVTVSGGKLTEDSVDDLEEIIKGMRGVGSWNRVALLESSFESSGLDEKGAAKIDIKNLSEYRKEDLMFSSYLDKTADSIRHRYRLPPLYVGSAESFTYATAKASKIAAEEQVFIPERGDFDEFINMRIVRTELQIYNWKFVSLGPKIVGSDELTQGIAAFTQAGAFTINHAIGLANEAFGMSMSKFDAEWANYPVPMVLRLVELAQLKGIDPIQAKLAPGTEDQKLLGYAQDKILKSDIFSAEEKDLYKRLITIQSAVEGKSSQLTMLMDDHHGADK